VTAKPSDVLIVSVRPFPGSQPANDTRPPAGARTAEPASLPMSIPLWPRSWYSGPPNANPRSTGPSTGQLQAAADDGTISPITIDVKIAVVFLVNIVGEPSRPGGCCQNRLQRPLIKPVARNAGQTRDDVGGRASRHTDGDELGHSLRRDALVGAGFYLARADHNRDLALHTA
jgi:hypothetical protein